MGKSMVSRRFSKKKTNPLSDMWFRCRIYMIYIDLWWLNGDLSKQNDDVMGRFKGRTLWQSTMARKFLIKMEASRWKNQASHV
jgi:hypothetical protein